MKAVRVSKPGGIDALEVVDVPDPVPGPGELTLDVKAAGVNHLDLWVRKGLPVAKYPIILGSDGAGIVRETGKRALLSPATSCGTCEFCSSGDKPLCVKYTIYGEHVNGTQAQTICVPAANLIPFPDTISFEEAAAAPLVYLTAWRMLITRGRLAPSEDVLIWSAGAGVGVAALQIAKLAGARVIATASSDEKCAKLRDLGADFVLNHAREDVVRRIRELTAKRGVDIVVDYIGRDTWARSVQIVRRGGRIVTCGATSGHDPAEDLRQIFFRQLEVIGCTMGNDKELQDALRPIFEGRIRPVIDSVLPLADVASAHQRIEQRAAFGKIVLTL
jgi:NADPH:quinone reductase-like Zn-dependent oxidoreductase